MCKRFRSCTIFFFSYGLYFSTQKVLMQIRKEAIEAPETTVSDLSLEGTLPSFFLNINSSLA